MSDYWAAFPKDGPFGLVLLCKTASLTVGCFKTCQSSLPLLELPTIAALARISPTLAWAQALQAELPDQARGAFVFSVCWHPTDVWLLLSTVFCLCCFLLWTPLFSLPVSAVYALLPATFSARPGGLVEITGGHLGWCFVLLCHSRPTKAHWGPVSLACLLTFVCFGQIESEKFTRIKQNIFLNAFENLDTPTLIGSGIFLTKETDACILSTPTVFWY